MKSSTKIYYGKQKRIKGLRRILREVVDDCLSDIAPYIVTDVLKLMKKMGLIYAKKKASNKKKTKSKR